MNYIKFFAEHGADASAIDTQGMSLLHIASWYGHQDALEYTHVCVSVQMCKVPPNSSPARSERPTDPSSIPHLVTFFGVSLSPSAPLRTSRFY